MNKVITVNLGGKAYQLEEGAHDALRAYMDEAAKQLAADPGRQEILADLEGALAEKCERFLSPAKNVVTGPEMDQLVKELGPVESSAPEAEKSKEPREGAAAGVTRLYRLKEEGYVAGICAGLGAYAGLDPTIIRILFVLLTLLTSGIWVFIYIILMFVIPRAGTEEQKAAAFGEPFTAREWVASAGHAAKQADGQGWRGRRREFLRRLREERRERRGRLYAGGAYRPLSFALALAGAAMGLAWFLGLVGIVSGGAAFGHPVPAGTPVWAALLGWSGLYALAALPLRLLRRGICCAVPGGQACGHYLARGADTLFRILLWTALVWAVWHYLPGTHAYFEKFAAAGNDLVKALTTP